MQSLLPKNHPEYNLTKKETHRILDSEEYREAHQVTIDEHRNRCVVKLSEKDQKKHQIVAEVMKMLEDNEIYGLLFAEMPMHSPESQEVHQEYICYHSAAPLLKYDKNGKSTFETRIACCKRFYDSVRIIAFWLMGHAPFPLKEWPIPILQTNYFQQCLALALNWAHGGIEPPEVQLLRKEMEQKEMDKQDE